GFPTQLKWQATINTASTPKYVVCNGDEGDPGTFMDRMLIESFPFRLIKGMSIAAKAVGAARGFVYIRAEYPLALERIYRAIEMCYGNRLLGQNIFDSDFSFDLSVQEGAGAFVCGEETALLESMEGRRGMPRLKPPFPAQRGLYGQPTLINNVETFALLPPIFASEESTTEFASLGTEKSKGTKVFALAGKIRRGGLIEVPMGTTLRQIVEEIGGGIQQTKEQGTRQFKAVQIGGPSGGCVPASLADTPVDFESLSKVGAIMGSGGLVVLDDRDCMVDIARYFLQFTQDQSCGKCTFCRIGTRRMLDILNRLCEGEGKPEDLAMLETLAEQIKAGSICGLGKTAPNPVLSTLRYFHEEYEAHVHGECPAGKCSALIQYQINEKCNGCSICTLHCPVSAIQAVPYRRHAIDTSACTKCDACRQNCPHGAVEVARQRER
ncbi:MAG: 4Fe-4S binding protein, partial [Planctomycetaceae bacterium]|nr:4Fe-4S binding protein [Planctomycetaceae bacterium]